MKTKRSTECAILMGLGACHGCASGSKLAFHVDFRAQIYRVRIFCGGQPQENIKTHALSIVDSSGVVRLTLGAPVPNPVVERKTKERRTPATGIIFNDAAGNERGGIGILDDGSMNFCFDDAKVERNCLFFMPKFGNGIAFNDASGESRAILYLDTTGAPHLLLRDDKGQPLVSLPEALKGTGAK
jgi:hypothetical protein